MGQRVHFCLAKQSSPERIAKQRELMQRTRPWEKSTGPKSADGKARSSRNGVTHGLTTRENLALKKAVRDVEQSLDALDKATEDTAVEDGATDE